MHHGFALSDWSADLAAAGAGAAAQGDLRQYPRSSHTAGRWMIGWGLGVGGRGLRF